MCQIWCLSLFFGALMNYNCIRAHFYASLFKYLRQHVTQCINAYMHHLIQSLDETLWECMDESVMPCVSPSVFMRVWERPNSFFDIYMCAWGTNKNSSCQREWLYTHVVMCFSDRAHLHQGIVFIALYRWVFGCLLCHGISTPSANHYWSERNRKTDMSDVRYASHIIFCLHRLRSCITNNWNGT